jgi:predicted DNA-binding transcriptional regulator YafY
MTATAGRLLKLLSLLQTPREWAGHELAARLRVSPRTVRRDVERLRDLGSPIRATMGTTGGYHLVAGAAVPPPPLDDEEAVALAVGLGAAAGHAVSGVQEASTRALAKLMRVLPTRLRHRVGTLNAATVPLLAWSVSSVDPERLTALATAIATHERLRFGYRASDGTESDRLVEPHRLVIAGQQWYLVAYDNGREAWRIFRVDRVRELRLAGTRAAARELPGEDAASYVLDRLSDLDPTCRAVGAPRTPAE